MGDPIRSTTFNGSHAVFQQDGSSEVSEAPKAAAPTQSAPASQSSTCESWNDAAAASALPQGDSGPTFSSNDLAARHSLGKAERERAKQAILELQGPLVSLAKKFPDPIGVAGQLKFPAAEVDLGAFGDVLRKDDFLDAAGKLSRRDVEAQLQAAVRQAWPNLSQDKQLELASALTAKAAEYLRDQAAFKLQDTAARMMRDSAKGFREVAGDPQKLKALAERLSRVGESPADQAKTQSLREAFGLDRDQRKVSVAELAKAMNERADLMEREASNMRKHSPMTLFRSLAEHDLGETFKERAGIQPGSFLAAQVDAVKEKGLEEKETIARAKFVTALATAMATGGVGGAAIGIGSSLAMSAPEVMLAWHAIDEARAAESAGTMKAGAGRKAERHAVTSTAVSVGSVAVGAAVSGALHKPIEAVAERLASRVAEEIVEKGAHVAVDAAVELAAERVGEAVEHHYDEPGEAGRNALDRAND
ncbi:MAG: hypothetical protein AB1938_26975 [Myxococcota bacterium]